MIVIDVRPFNTVYHEGFLDLIEFIYQAGYEQGVMTGQNNLNPPPVPSIKDYVPSDKTVKEFIMQFVAAELPGFNDYVSYHIHEYGGGISCDFGSKQANYFASSVQFITKDCIVPLSKLEFFEVNFDTAILILTSLVEAFCNSTQPQKVLKLTTLHIDNIPGNFDIIGVEEGFEIVSEELDSKNRPSTIEYRYKHPKLKWTLKLNSSKEFFFGNKCNNCVKLEILEK
uniref:Uncharacterized protein n=1 Tax=Acrobeloides nanus TaxID=290746 RepID=A0A914CA93_9BILA